MTSLVAQHLGHRRRLVHGCMTAKDHYQKLELESRVAGADQFDLILALYEELINSLTLAQHYLKGDSLAQATASADRARSITIYLLSSLDMERGGQLSSLLANAYRGMLNQIDGGIRQQQPHLLTESLDVARQLYQSWASARKTAAA